MIPGTQQLRQIPAWQQALARAVTDPGELLEMLGLSRDLLPGAHAAGRYFPLRVPRGFVARMRRGDPRDPLLRQVLPLDEERREVAGFGADPVGDLAAMAVPGVLHKYRGRVLLTVTGACAVHCRYCFRRQYPYSEANPAAANWGAALDYIAADDTIREVILSGGDPLTLSDRRLEDLLQPLAEIAHVRRLRIHTRLPIVLPERMTGALLHLLAASRLQPVLVVHANHAREIDPAVRQSLGRVRQAGIALLNQSVLLRGVNDSPAALAQLSEALFEAGVLPYYLHMLDKVRGAAHFEVSAADAGRILAELSARLPGYLVPRLVRETAGAPAKQPLRTTGFYPVDP